MVYFASKSLYNKFAKTTIIDALFYLSNFLFFSFFSPYLSTLGWGESMKGVFFALFSITGLVFSSVVGSLSDSLGRFKMILLGFFLQIIALVGYIFITSTAGLLVVRIIAAIAFNLVVVSSLARVNDVVTNANRGRLTGLFYSIISVVAVVAPLIGGFIADQYGFRSLFVVSLVVTSIFFAGLLLFDFFFFDVRKHFFREQKKTFKKNVFNPFRNIADFLKIKELRLFSFLGLASGLTIPLQTLVLPFFIIDKLGLSNSHLSIAIFLLGLAMTFQFVFGYVADRIGSARCVVVGLLLSAIGFILLFFMHTFEFMVLVVFLISVGRALWNVSAWSYLSRIGETNNVEGNVVGSYSAISKLSVFISFLVSGFVLVALQEYIFLIYGLVLIVPLLFLSRKLISNEKKFSG